MKKSLFRTLSGASALLMTLSPSLMAKSIWEKVEMKPNFGFNSNYVDNKQVEARTFGLMVGSEFELPYSDELKIEVSGGAMLEVGSSNSFIVDEYAPSRLWTLRYAQAVYTPFSFLKIEGGAISNKEYELPNLMGKSAFLGIRESLIYEISKKHKVYIKAQQSIPNNINLNQRIGVVEDGTPQFYIETIGADLEGDLLGIKLEASQFRFESLSTGIAYQSQFFDNSITGLSSVNSKFLYEFNGNALYGALNFALFGDFVFRGAANYIYNDSAPDGRNTSYIYKPGIGYGDYTVYFSTFRSESDTSPGYYNSKYYAHNNAKGTAIKFQYKIEDEIDVSLDYVKTSPIETSAYKSNSDALYFKFMQYL